MKYNFRAVIAVAMAILMVTGMIAPVTATGIEDPTSMIDQSTVQNDDLSALEHRAAAYEILAQNDEQRQFDRLNETFEHVLDENRIDARSVFHEDRLVVAETQAHYSEAADHLVASDRALAETVVADARRVVEEMQRRNHSYNETAVEDYLANATENLEEGHTHVEDDEPVAAVEAYQRAWTAAQRALDVMQAAVDPQVEITRRRDMPHDGNFTYTVEGVVWDVRSHRMNGSLTVNGAASELELNTSTVPGANVTFERTITLEQRINRINVSVTNPLDYVDYDRVGDRPLDEEGGPPGDGGPSNDSEIGLQVGYDVLKLDGDGLSDRYEETVLGTRPLTPDSDSRFTEQNESDQGTFDGAKDFSGDGLTTYQEYRIGTDPLANDTTGDGLEDGFQVYRAGTDPLVNDTDGDGTPDAEENLSGDNLTLIEEQEHDTNPLVKDSDADGLTDYQEIHEYATNPLDPDTSGSGLTDGEEVRLGLDPTLNETRPGETFTTTTVNETSDVEVAATGEGVVADDVFVRHQPAARELNFSAGPMVRITNTTTVERAEVRMPISEDVDLASTDVQIYRWDPDTEEGWVPVETEIDRTNRTAMATVSSFSYFAVFDADQWTQNVKATAKPGWPALEQFEDLDGWTAEGNVTLDGKTVTVQSEAGPDERPEEAVFEVVDFTAPSEATEGETITVTATIENTGSANGTQRVEYVFGGTRTAWANVSLAPGEQQDVKVLYTIYRDNPDIVPEETTETHLIRTEDDVHEAEITIYDEDEEEDDSGPVFEVTDFEGPVSAEAGTEIDVEATVRNTGEETATTTVRYVFNGSTVDSKDVTLAPGSETTVRFEYQIPALTDEGYYYHEANGSEEGVATGEAIYVEGRFTPHQPLQPQIQLPSGFGDGTSLAVRPSADGVTGRYGAATNRGGDDVVLLTAANQTATAGQESGATSTLSRSINLPDLESIPVQVRVRARTQGEGDRAAVVLENGSTSFTVFERTDGDGRFGWVTVTADAWALAGDNATLTVRTEGNATIEVDYVSIMPDSTGSGIPDAVEVMDLRMPTGPPDAAGTPLNLNPNRADTSGDGLPDGEQVDVYWQLNQNDSSWRIEAWAVHASAHPGMADTDGDGMSDHDELREVGTDPMAVDTSGEGFTDQVDAKPNRDSSPIQVTVEMNADDQIVVTASGPARLGEIGARGYYTMPEEATGWIQWELVDTELEQVGGSWVRTSVFEPHLAAGMVPPAAVEFNVSDARGQTQRILLARDAYDEADGQSLASTADDDDDDDGLLDGFIDWVTGDARLLVATVFLVSTTTVTGGGVLGVALNPKALAALAVILAVGAMVAYSGGLPNPDWVVEEFAKTTKLAAPLTGGEAAKFPAAETDPEIDYPVTLPPGADYGNGRGYGWEIVKRTPGITEKSDVGEILRAPNAIEQDGSYTLVIGDNPNRPGQVILRLRQGVIISASQLIEDPTGQHIEINRNNRHPVNRPGHPDNWDIIERAIRNPTQIWENVVPHGVERHYIAKIGGKWVVVRAYWEGSRWVVSTAVEYASKAEVKEYIRERNLDKRVYGDPL